ncbi:MAG: fused MFS/spermidine synthase [Planctomycetes bacterium]|nr:fused MFS/spermidine synthase [Planctomycetota bacterium]
MTAARRSQLLLSGAFFLASGATALAYEVVWFKRFAHVFGSSAHAWAAVVAAYLLGLGLGARWLDAFAARSTRPLFAYGVCEIVVSVCAFAIPFEIAWLGSHGAAWSSALGSAPWAQALVRFGLAFVVLAPATIAMGATLPLLVRHFVRHGESAAPATSVLYALNALGAGVGAWLAGFDLLPALGLARANGLLIAASLSIGIAACALGRGRTAEARPPDDPERRTATPERRRDARLALAAAATGAGALMLQMLWSRELAVLVGGTTYAYSALLAIYVAGLGLGSLGLRLFGGRADPLRAVAWSIVVLLAATLLGKALQPWLALSAGQTIALRADAAGDTSVCLVFAAVLVFVPTLAMGAVFPSLVRLGARDASDAGAVGFVYGWNTFGAIPAAALTHVVLFPTLGSTHTYRLALGLYLAALLVLWSPRLRSLAAPVVVGLGALGLVWLPRPLEPLDTHRGNYLYGNVAKDTPATALRTLFFETGASSDVLVAGYHEDALPNEPRYSQRYRALFVNGKVDATNVNDMQTQVVLAYVPRFVRPLAKSVLVIGFGSGTTAGASLLADDTQVTCVEIEPAVARAAREFVEVNHAPWTSPRFELVHDDGRAYLAGSERRYDLIVSEPSNPWIAGVANLYTEEFYRTAAEKLSRGGVLAQWLQCYALDARDYALVLRTLKSVFSHVAVVRINESDTIVLASRERLVPSADELDRVQAWIDGQPDVRADLERWCGTRDARTVLLRGWLLDELGIDRLLAADGGTDLHRDATLQLEFSGPRALFAAAGSLVAPQHAIARAADLAFVRDQFLAWRCGEAQVDALAAWKDLLLTSGRRDAAAQVVELALTFASDRPAWLVDQLVLDTEVSADELVARIDRLVTVSPEFAFEAGTILAQNGLPGRAVPVFERLRTAHPDAPRVLTALATCYATLGRDADARAALERAREVDPFDALGRDLERVMSGAR